jgi:selT/selW/selH-like putative selenoprotein
LAASLKQEFGVEAELIRGTNGVFDVAVDGQLVFSKHQLRRFPEDGEVEAAIRALRTT